MVLRCLWIFILLMMPAAAAFPQSIPVNIKGHLLWLEAQSSRATLAGSLRAVLAPEEPSVDSPERLQYDVIAVEGQGLSRLCSILTPRGV